jgi:hypothetical protein
MRAQKIFLQAIIILLPAFSLSQTHDDPATDPKVQSEIICNNVQDGEGCNFIRNNIFLWDCFDCNGSQATINPCWPCNPNLPGCQGQYLNPFGFCFVPEWENSHGTPQLQNSWLSNITSPVPGSYAAIMWSSSTTGGLAGEGLAQQIKRLEGNHKYLLSFYKNFSYCSQASPLLENFNVVILDCEDYHREVNPGNNWGYQVPPTPSSAQTVYCERNITTMGWQRNVAIFTASGRGGDIIWIFPRLDPANVNYTEVWFAYPELIDITNFTAGPSPIVNYPNCNVTIGPGHANCYPSGAVFYWTGPQGQTVPITNPNNQQITVNAATAYGTWTLHMRIPSVNVLANNTPTVLATSNSCSTNTDEVTATVYVAACTSCNTNTGSWPKVYDGKAPEYLFRDNTCDLFMFLHESDPSQNTNHNGVLPGAPFTGEYSFQYTFNGTTNWTKTDVSPLFVLQNGNVQLSNYTYVDGNTGTIVSGPALVPANEQILAETSTGSYITKTGTNLYVHSTSGTTSVSTGQVYKTFFNLTSNKFFTIETYPVFLFKVYNLVGNNLVLSYNNSLPSYPNAPELVQITNGDRAFVVKNAQLQEYDYVNNSFSPVGVAGFNNNSILAIASNNPYTADKCAVISQADNYLSAIDLTTLTERKIQTSNFDYGNFMLYYVLNGDNLYLAGIVDGLSPTIIGSQSIQPVPGLYNSYHSIFLTKFSLQNDFTTRSAVDRDVKESLGIDKRFSVTILPNPAKSVVHIMVSGKTGNVYKISVLNANGSEVLTKETKQDHLDLNISMLQKGMYYLVVTNKEGKQLTRSFVKQ